MLVCLALVEVAPAAATPFAGRHLVLVDASSGSVTRNFPDVDGTVATAIADGRGGWFIGGGFTRVGSAARSRLARLTAGGRLDPRFRPALTASVTTLARKGSVLFAGSGFGVTAFDALTGKRLWRTRASPVHAGRASVLSLAIGGGVLYVAGSFGRIGGIARTDVAGLDLHTGRPTAWHVELGLSGTTPTVEAVTVGYGAVYLGGVFDTVDGAARANLAAVSPTTGRPTARRPWPAPPWLPDVSIDEVRAVAVTHHQILAGGHGFGVVDARTGRPVAWRRRIVGGATTFAVSGSTVYLGGGLRDGFRRAGGRPANNLAAVRLPAGAFSAWRPQIARYTNVQTLAVSRGTVLVGGEFTDTLG